MWPDNSADITIDPKSTFSNGFLEMSMGGGDPKKYISKRHFSSIGIYILE